MAVLTVAAIFLRVWNLGDAPYGMHGDEAAFGMDGLRIANGEPLGVWTGVVLGNPSGYSYWVASIFRLAGENAFTLRLASAIPGAAIVPVGYLLIRSLFPFRVAILSAAMAACSFWFIMQSRLAFPMITSTLFAMLAMYLAVSAIRSGRLLLAILAGAALGLGLYTFKAFLIYFAAFWAAAALTFAFRTELMRQTHIWAMLGISAVVGWPILRHYLDTGYAQNNLEDFYGVSLFSPSDWLDIPSHALHAILLVHNPVQGQTIDAALPIPLLSIISAIFFWVGLATVVLFINKGRNKLLLLGWLIGMAPILIVPGSESRRYLLGIFFVLTIVSIGFNAILPFLITELGKYIPSRFRGLRAGARFGYAAGVVLAVVFMSVFAFRNYQNLDDWLDSHDVEWFFSHDHFKLFEFIRTLDTDYDIRYYSDGVGFGSDARRFALPEYQGTDGAQNFGGDGTLFSGGALTKDTVFVFMGVYLELAPELESVFPSAQKIGELIEDDRTIFTAYLIPVTPVSKVRSP